MYYVLLVYAFSVATDNNQPSVSATKAKMRQRLRRVVDVANAGDPLKFE